MVPKVFIQFQLCKSDAHWLFNITGTGEEESTETTGVRERQLMKRSKKSKKESTRRRFTRTLKRKSVKRLTPMTTGKPVIRKTKMKTTRGRLDKKRMSKRVRTFSEKAKNQRTAKVGKTKVYLSLQNQMENNKRHKKLQHKPKESQR